MTPEAWAGLSAVIVAIVGAAGLVLASTRGNSKAIGRPNGAGTLVEMAERTLIGIGRLNERLDEHAQSDTVQFTAMSDQDSDNLALVRERLDIIETYAHESKHNLANEVHKIHLTMTLLRTGIERLEAGAVLVAQDLARAQSKVVGVAADLADSHLRADAVRSGIPGEAADAASQSPEVE